MRYDISKLKRFETDAECSKRNQKIIRALEKEPKLSKVVGQCIKGCEPYRSVGVNISYVVIANENSGFNTCQKFANFLHDKKVKAVFMP